MTVCNQPSTENCPDTCPNYFLDNCPVMKNKARAEIIAAGLKELPIQLHSSWTWFAERCAMVPGKERYLYIEDFKERLDY